MKVAIWRGGKFNTCQHLAAEELVGGVALGQLSARTAAADLSPEVHFELVGRLARRGKWPHLDDAADAHVDLQEVVEGDGGSLGHQSQTRRDGLHQKRA